MGTQDKTGNRNIDAGISIGPDATIGDKVRALRLSKKMTMADLARTSGLSDRAIRYIETNQRKPSIDAIKRLSAALGVATNFFMEDILFQEEMDKEAFLEQASKKYGSKGKAQAAAILDQTQTLYSGGELTDEDKEMFRNEMMAIFWDSKDKARKFTPKKLLED